jgi:RNA polymerase sigma factor (sigma-70 family)
MLLSNAPRSQDDNRQLSPVDAEDSAGTAAMPPYRPISAALAIAPTVSVIIPARDEAANLPHVFSTLPPWVDEVVLVDGHSVDDTVAVTRALCPKAKVVTQPGRGKGDALHAGFVAASGDILVTIDADGSTDGAEIIRFVGALVAGADFAKGSRFSSSGGSDDITWVRRYGNRLLSGLVNRMFGTHFSDLCYGYNAFWARHLDAIEVSSCPGFEVEALMNIRAATAGLTIYEVPSHECARIFGASNLRAIRDGWRILKVILRERLCGPRNLAGASAPASVASGDRAEAFVGPYVAAGHARPMAAHDREVVAAIAAGDATGVGAAFDRYGQDLYTYCRSQLHEPADAADAVRDTFVIASAQISRLSQPDRLRGWLFALARNECQSRQRTAVPSARLYEAAQAMDDTGTFAVTEQAETRALVRAALAGMDPVDREIAELHLRHGFYGVDLADVLGAPRNRAHALASRARSRFERSLGVLPVARSGREHCPDLATVLEGQGGKPVLPLRWRIRRHIRRCQACGARKRCGLNPAILLGIFPVIPLPTALRQGTLAVVADESPTAVAHRARVTDHAAGFGADGFPVQLTTPSVPGRRLTSLSAAAAAAAALALLGGAIYDADPPSGHCGPAAATGVRPSLAGRERSGAAACVPADVPSAGGRTPAPELVRPVFVRPVLVRPVLGPARPRHSRLSSRVGAGSTRPRASGVPALPRPSPSPSRLPPLPATRSVS